MNVDLKPSLGGATPKKLAIIGRRKSPSTSSTREFCAARVIARLIVVKVLPSPGIALVTRITGVSPGTVERRRFVRKVRYDSQAAGGRLVRRPKYSRTS